MVEKSFVVQGRHVLAIGNLSPEIRSVLSQTVSLQVVKTLPAGHDRLSNSHDFVALFLLPSVLSQNNVALLEELQEQYHLPCIILKNQDTDHLTDAYCASRIFACLHVDDLTPRMLRQWIRQAVLCSQQKTQLNELNETQSELIENKRLIDRIFMTMSDAVNVFDVIRSKHLYGNHRIAENLGYTKAEINAMASKLVDFLIHPDDLQIYHDHKSEVLTTQADKITRIQVRMKNKQGGWSWVQSDYSILRRNEAGQVLEILGVARDITESKQIEHDLQYALHQEIRLNEHKAQFIRVTSHEFRTPLAVIQTSVGSLKRFYERLPEDKREEKYQRIYEQIHHLTKMVNDLLSIVQMDRVHPEAESLRIDVADYLQRLIDDFELAHALSGRVHLTVQAGIKQA